MSCSLTDAPVELPIAVTSKQVRDVLKSELSTSVPVATPVIAVGTSGNQIGLSHSQERDTHLQASTETVHSQEGPKTGKCDLKHHFNLFRRYNIPVACVIVGIFYSLISSDISEVYYETESRRGTRISLHQEKPTVYWSKWRVSVSHCRPPISHFYQLSAVQ